MNKIKTCVFTICIIFASCLFTSVIVKSVNQVLSSTGTEELPIQDISLEFPYISVKDISPCPICGSNDYLYVGIKDIDEGFYMICKNPTHYPGMYVIAYGDDVEDLCCTWIKRTYIKL